MKRLSALLLILLLAAALFAPSASAVDTSNYDYYIKNYDVSVTAHSDRSFDVVEKIDVFFNLESHGIYRDIDLYGAAEEFGIENVRVDAPFEHDGYGYLRIGDADRLITGDKSYTISYTLTSYAEQDKEHDYLYLDLIGTEWECPILDYTCVVTLPENAVAESCKLTGGGYSSTGDVAGSLASVEFADNVYTIRALKPLGRYEGLTINVEMAEGAYPDAREWVPEIIADSLDVSIVMDKYGKATVTEKMEFTVGQDGVGYFSKDFDFSIDAENYDDLGIKCSEVTLSSSDGVSRVAIGYHRMSVSFERYLNAGDRGSYTAVYDLEFETVDDAGSLDWYLCFGGSGKDVLYENVSLNIETPFDAEATAWRGGVGIYGSGDIPGSSVPVTGSGTRHITSDFEGDQSKYSDLNVRLGFGSDAAFARRGSLIAKILAPAIAAIAAIVSLFFATVLKNKKPLVTPISFYPPEGMNPPETGYVPKNSCSARDVTSLIYYWAAQGHLEIEVEDKKHFTLHRVSELGGDNKAYERAMFDKLFDLGDGKDVTDRQLKERAYKCVDAAAKSVNEQFKGENSLIEKSSKLKSGLLSFLVPALGLGSGAFAAASRGFGISAAALMGCVFLFVGSVIIGLAVRTAKRGSFGTQSGCATIVLGLFGAVWSLVGAGAFIFGAGGRAMPFASAAVIALSTIAGSVSAPFAETYTEKGSDLLGKVLGFKQFLTTAKKDKLEMLLEQNPDYYYNTLPFAQVLGVSKIWLKKFDDLTIPPPSYVSGDVGSFNTYWMLSSMNNMNAVMNSRPASSSGGGGGGFSGGFSGGGSFSGGGFSGGGGGGGGGGRW